MNNFCFHNPTKIIFGRNTIDQIGQETLQYGNKILLVYGMSSIKRHGLYDKICESLSRADLKIVEHGGVRSNPLLSHVREGIKLAKDHAVDSIVAVGGGSVIDSAKAIGAGAMAEHDIWQFFKGKKGIKQSLPVLCVPTIAAAGAEMNSGMVITNDKTKQKIGIGNKLLLPKVSILDPTTTYSVPPDYTAFGAVDALAHLLEFYMTAEAQHTPVQDRLMEGLSINIISSCEQVLTAPTDYDSRADLMWCATLALNGLPAAGLGMVGFPMHMIAHSLGALYDAPHGAALAAVMPGWLSFQAERYPAKLSQFAEKVLKITKADEFHKAVAAIEWLKTWFAKISCPTCLADLSISENHIPEIAENALSQAKLWRLREYTKEIIEEILRLCR